MFLKTFLENHELTETSLGILKSQGPLRGVVFPASAPGGPSLALEGGSRPGDFLPTDNQQLFLRLFKKQILSAFTGRGCVLHPQRLPGENFWKTKLTAIQFKKCSQ